MGHNSQTGQVGFGLQSAKGTAVAATRFARLKRGGMVPDRELMVPDPEIGGNRDVTQASMGPVAYAGDIEFYCRMQMLALLGYGAFGNKVSSALAEGDQHVLTGADVIPWMTMEERISTSLESMRYTDVKVNSLRVEVEPEGFFMGSANLIGLKGQTGFAAQGAPAYDLTPLMVGTQVTVSLGGTTIPVKSMNFEINNNLETGDFVLGQLEAQDSTEKRRDITGGFTFRPEDSDLFKSALLGASNITTPRGGPAYEEALVITATSFEFAEGTTPFSVAMSIPHAAISPHSITPSGDDTISSDVEFRALRPSNATPAATMTIVNDLAAVN